MRNISKRKDFYENFRVFSPRNFGPEHAKHRVGIPTKFRAMGWGSKIEGEKGGQKNFDSRSRNFFRILDIYGTHIPYEFHDPSSNSGAWGDNRRN